MIPLKRGQDLEKMRRACRVARQVLDELAAAVKPGCTTRELDDLAGVIIARYGARSAFLGYRKYPCQCCISVNDEVVHGMGKPTRRLEFGDIVSLDVGVVVDGFVGDTAHTVPVGGCSLEAQRLLDVTEKALFDGIAAARAGNRVTDISRAVQRLVEANGFGVVREFTGHGVGRNLHEEPQIPNYVDPACNDRLLPGMTLAIEPMVTAGKAAIKILNDRWTAVTLDGSLSAHFEHTVLVTEGDPEVLTCSAPARL